MNKQFEMCSFWMMEKPALCVCVCVLGPILWWHMSCPMLCVLPLRCNNTPQCCLKYSWPGKPITLSQSHGFLIITPLCYGPQVTIFHLPLLQPPHLSAAACASHSQCWGLSSKCHCPALYWIFFFLHIGFQETGAGRRLWDSEYMLVLNFLFLPSVLTWLDLTSES